MEFTTVGSALDAHSEGDEFEYSVLFQGLTTIRDLSDFTNLDSAANIQHNRIPRGSGIAVVASNYTDGRRFGGLNDVESVNLAHATFLSACQKFGESLEYRNLTESVDWTLLSNTLYTIHPSSFKITLLRVQRRTMGTHAF
eukprot:GFKZ01009242.1.p1 GENE.GFKZ01009242.1~~GFKZ01009242.1.p1  ORF type:complete len:141 (+),score=12.68 GFKZ01009242.1:241-663(+)